MPFPARVNVVAAAVWTSTTGTTLATAATSATTGNTLVVAVGGGATAGQTVTGIADTAGNTYTKVTHVFEAVDKYREEVWYAKNITGHASNVVTVTWSAAVGFRGMVVAQYSGLDAAAPLDSFATGTAPSPTKTVTTGTLTTTKWDDLHLLLPRWGVTSIAFPTGFGANFSGDANVVIVEQFLLGPPYVGTYTETHASAWLPLALAVAFAPAQVGVPRVSHDTVEALSLPVPRASVTQDRIEILTATTPIPGRVSHYAVEVLSLGITPSDGRMTQYVVEALSRHREGDYTWMITDMPDVVRWMTGLLVFPVGEAIAVPVDVAVEIPMLVIDRLTFPASSVDVTIPMDVVTRVTFPAGMVGGRHAGCLCN